MHASQTLVTVNELGPARLIDRIANHWWHTFEIERSGNPRGERTRRVDPRPRRDALNPRRRSATRT